MFVAKIGWAFILGMIIGIERQWRKCSAGLRTNVLVAVGAAIFMTMAEEIGDTAPERIASYIVSGMSFLGAGVILKDGASIRGLNTAATLWGTAAIGAFCGQGFVLYPFLACIFILGTHILLRPVSDKIRKMSPINISEHEEYRYLFSALCKETDENHIRTLFVQYIGNNNNLILKSISSTDTTVPGMVEVNVEMMSIVRQDRSLEKVASFLTLEKSITSVKWELE